MKRGCAALLGTCCSSKLEGLLPQQALQLAMQLASHIFPCCVVPMPGHAAGFK